MPHRHGFGDVFISPCDLYRDSRGGWAGLAVLLGEIRPGVDHHGFTPRPPPRSL